MSVSKLSFLILFFVFINFNTSAQTDRWAYAVTDSTANIANWNWLRKVDTKTGEYSSYLIRLLSDADLAYIHPENTVVCAGVAAIAVDKKSKRLYFTPMLIDRLSYVDLQTMRIHVVANQFSGLHLKSPDQSNIFTRMAIAENDFGYALTNDGKHLLRFSTRTSAVTDLGSLVDAPSNGEYSIHNGCQAFGGDMVADDEGNLLLLTSGNLFYKIDVQTKVATYKGKITGLPANFFSSSLAVSHSNNKLIVAGNVNTTNIYSIDVNNLQASAVGSIDPDNSADFSNSTVYRTGSNLNLSSIAGDKFNIEVYPNPVTSRFFSIRTSNIPEGRYFIELADVNGSMVEKTQVQINSKTNSYKVSLSKQMSQGVYLIRLSDMNGNQISTTKIFISIH